MINMNTIGFVQNGDMKGFFVKIVDDRDVTGGYYILFSKDFNKKNSEGYDELYFDLNVIKSRIDEMTIQWLDTKEEKDED